MDILDRKKVLKLMLIVLLVWGVFVIGYLLVKNRLITLWSPLTKPEISSQNKVSLPVVLALSPPQGNFSVGNSTKIAVILDTGEKKVIGADAIIKYDPEKIEIIELKPGTIFDHYPFTKINAGKVFISAINDNDHLFSGQGILTHLTIVPKKPGEAKLRFEFRPAETTDSNVAAENNQQDVLEQVKNGVYTFE